MTTADPSNPLPPGYVPVPDVPPLPNVPPLPPSLLANPRVVPAGAATQWIATGWEMFKAAPGAWIAIVVVYIIAMAVIGAVPFLGVVNIVLNPILSAGIIAACELQRRGTAPRLENLFAGFQKATGNLAILGLLYMAGVLAVTLTVGAGGMAMMLPFIVAQSAAGSDFTMTPGMIGIIVACLMLAMFLFVPLGLAMMWAPPLVFVHDVGPFEALKRGLFACLRNWMALLVFFVVAALLLIPVMLTLGLGMLVFAPVMLIAIWAGYREVFVA